MSDARFPETVATMLVKIRDLGPESDSVQWTRLWNLYAAAMRAFAVRKGGEADADDIVMAVLGKLVKVLREGQYDPAKGAFHSYLATMISNEVHMKRRRDVARRADDHVSLDAPGRDGDEDGDGTENPIARSLVAEVAQPGDSLDEEWRKSILAAATEHALTKTALNARDVAVYRAFAIDEEPIEKVAKRFGMTRNAVSQVKCRIQKRVEAAAHEMLNATGFGLTRN